MGIIGMSVDTDSILNQFGEFKVEVEKELVQQIKELSAQVHSFIIQKVQSELKSTRQTYLDNLSDFIEVSPGVYLCTLEEPAMFIEEGIPQNFDMKPGLLKNAKSGEGGIRYKIIPMNHNATGGTITQQLDRKALRSAIRPVSKQMRMETGDRSLGALKPRKDAAGNYVPTNQGYGTLMMKDLKLGGRIPGKGNTPIFDNLNIYQKTKPTGKSAKMSAMTFRTVTSGPGSQGKWLHPGLQAKKILDAGLQEAINIWEGQMQDEFIRRMQAKWK